MKKTQTGWVFIITLGALSIFTLFLEQGKEVSPIVLSAFAFVLLMSYKLTVKADDEGVSFSMGIGLIRRKFKYENIEACKVIHYFPIGYGIRFRLGSTLYNVSGTKAIELTIKGKNRKVWIGTAHPDEFVDYINARIKA